MDWHTIQDTKERDVLQFEKNALSEIGLIPEIESRYQVLISFTFFPVTDIPPVITAIRGRHIGCRRVEAFKEKKNVFDPETLKPSENFWKRRAAMIL